MQKEHFKWVTLDNTDGTGSLKQHAFIPQIRERRYTGEEYVANISVCGSVFADDGSGDEQVGEWAMLVDETQHTQCCKRCKNKVEKMIKH